MPPASNEANVAARAYIETKADGVRAVCRETGVVTAFFAVGAAERVILAMLSEACDCDDYHSVVEDEMDQADAVNKQAIKDAIEAEMKKAEAARQQAQWNVEAATRELAASEARKRELETALAAGESLVGALDQAEVVATGVFSADFSPSKHLRLELVQGLKEGDSMRMCYPSIPDKKAELVVRILGDVDKNDTRPMHEREEWHVLVLMRRMKKAGS